MKILDACDNQRGAVLVIGLIFMAILSIMGTAAYLTTSSELMISRNYKTAKAAFYAAEAGVEEARERLRGSNSDANYAGDPDASPDQWWSAYILTSSSWQTPDDPNYDSNYQNYIPTTTSHTATAITANSLQSNISYWVKIRHKREYDAEQEGHTTTSTHYFDNDGSTSTHSAADPGNIIYYGYGNPATPTTAVQFTTSGATEHKPVEIIRAYGSRSNSSKIIEVEVVRNPGPVIKAAIYARGNVTVNGNSARINGNDAGTCGGVNKPPVYTKTPATTSADPVTLLGNPNTATSGPDDLNIAGYVSSLKASAIITITSDVNGTNFGSATNFVTCYCDATAFHPLGLDMRNSTGYGILLVEGDLTMAGGFNWNGLVLCTGTLTFSGGGPNSINIQGAMLANNTVTLNGGINVTYDSCMVDNSLNNATLSILSWKQS